MNNREKYKQAFSVLRVSDEMTWEQIKEQCENSGKGKRTKREGDFFGEGRTILGMRAGVAVLCGCLVLLLTGGTIAYAAGALKPVAELFAKVFQISEQEKGIVEKIGEPVGTTVTYAGLKITTDGVIRDTEHLAVIFSIEREDGKPFDPGKYPADKWSFHSIELQDGNVNMTPYAGSYLSYDENPEDAAIQFVLFFSDIRQEWYDTDKVWICLEDFQNYKGYDDGVLMEPGVGLYAEGVWRIEVPVKAKDTSVTILENEVLELEGKEVQIERLSVSPIGFSLTVAETDKMKLSATEFSEWLEKHDFSLELENGERISLSDSADAVSWDEGGKGRRKKNSFVDSIMKRGVTGDEEEDEIPKAQYAGTFERIIEPGDMKSVHIGELELPVK